jgi:hypothetical protein
VIRRRAVLDGAPRRSVSDAAAVRHLQQLAGAAARTIDGRAARGRGAGATAARGAARRSDAQLRAAGLSRQKIKAVRSVAEAFEKRATSRIAACARWTTTR